MLKNQFVIRRTKFDNVQSIDKKNNMLSHPLFYNVSRKNILKTHHVLRITYTYTPFCQATCASYLSYLQHMPTLQRRNFCNITFEVNGINNSDNDISIFLNQNCVWLCMYLCMLAYSPRSTNTPKNKRYISNRSVCLSIYTR